ncbi:MAG TPA: hypothetical protein DE315_04060 [Candidatus Omnitrophica bacterium]|nr:hypothetical protein [Candidatus Omnitrophota bacterium]HCI44689.1 hypothetical protein [Candidatus Omnitrophota bacterium]
MREAQGFTIVELMVTTLIFSVITIGMYSALLAGQSAWSTTDTQIRLQEALRQTLQRVAAELGESGEDGNGIMQMTIGDNTGANGTDILTFSIPVCVCSNTPIDANGDVTNWGAPLSWGKTNCPSDITLNADGKVSICHLPPGNPENTQDLEIAPAALDAHLSHGDWLGSCTACSITGNKFVEYVINASNRLLRRVRNSVNALVKEETISENVTGLQAVFSADQNIVTLTVTALADTTQNRQITVSRVLNVRLKNK